MELGLCRSPWPSPVLASALGYTQKGKSIACNFQVPPTVTACIVGIASAQRLFKRKYPCRPLSRTATVLKTAAQQPEVSHDAEQYLQELLSEGAVVIPNVFTLQQIQEFSQHHHAIFADVLSQMSLKDGMPATYEHRFRGEQTATRVESWTLEDGSEALRLGRGRYDYTYGMDSGCFSESSFQSPAILAEVIGMALGSDYTHYAGALPSESRCSVGFWHRDTLPLFQDEKIDILLPPFYYTVLIPLVPMTLDNGATEIILGSHRKSDDELEMADDRSHFKAVCEPGSVVVFDGRCCHRGMPNISGSDRSALYMVWHKAWYNDTGSMEFEFRNHQSSSSHYGREGHAPSFLKQAKRSTSNSTDSDNSEGEWLHPHVSIRDSRVHGQGLFVSKFIQQGEVVWRHGELSAEPAEDNLMPIASLLEMDPSDAEKIVHFAFQVSETHMYVGNQSRSREVSDFTNHSCNPTTVFDNSCGTMIARQDLHPGDEITYDYATSEATQWPWSSDGFPCACGSKNCRGRIHFDDWRLPQLRAKYGKHGFVPYIQTRMDEELISA